MILVDNPGKILPKSIFKDKYTNKVYKLNDELDVTDERYEEVKQYVEKIEKNNKKKADK